MATVTGLTAERMLEIEAESVVDGDIVGNNLILTKHDGTQINAGPVIGPQGPQGPQGPVGLMGIPGEIKLWPGATLPDSSAYGHWTWANADIFDVATYPKAAANISPAWKTAMGLPDPGPGKFRVPDLRGLTPAGLDAMPVGSARANRVARAAAIVLATKTGEEYHVVSVPEMPWHGHGASMTPAGDHSHGFTPGGSMNMLVTKQGTQPGNVVGNIGAAGAYNTGLNLGAQVTAPAGAHGHGLTIDGNGGGGGHETLQPTIFIPYIVKLDD